MTIQGAVGTIAMPLRGNGGYALTLPCSQDMVCKGPINTLAPESWQWAVYAFIVQVCVT